LTADIYAAQWAGERAVGERTVGERTVGTSGMSGGEQTSAAARAELTSDVD
jgi:hypothetical protein